MAGSAPAGTRHQGQGDHIPRSSILISFRCCIRSLLSWFSISSFLSFPSLSSVLIPQPISTEFRHADDEDSRKTGVVVDLRAESMLATRGFVM